MDNFLDRMARSSRERARLGRDRESIGALAARAEAAPEPLPLKLQAFDLIAELKLRSPAAGGLAGHEFNPGRQLESYAKGGAAGVSILTEPEDFRGCLEHLQDAASQLRPLSCPVMRKDFLVDPYQVIEARANGASGVLLIAAMLTDAALDELFATARELGLFVLLEAFDSDDLDRLGRLAPAESDSQVLIGINSRNLKTLNVDFNRFGRLAGQIREDVPAVAESGIENVSDIEAVAKLGFCLALVGSALMRDDDAENTVASFIAAGRRVTRGQAACS